MSSRAATQRRKDQTAKDRGPGIAITRDGKTLQVYAKDLNALDSRALRMELGLSFVGLLEAAKRDMDIDLLAAVEWLTRRVNGEKHLEYAEVAATWDYETDFAVPTNLDTTAEPATPDGIPET